jgi:hypothetical protein
MEICHSILIAKKACELPPIGVKSSRLLLLNKRNIRMPTIAELTAHLNQKQISREVGDLLQKVQQGKHLTKTEQATLVNPTEAAALLSVKYGRHISHRYIKELTRDVTNPKTGTTTPRRLNAARMAGTAFLYRVGDVLAVLLRERKIEREGT